MSQKQFLFTNEILYEKNIADRIWPMFLEAQVQNDLAQALVAVKCYYLFTQQWYQKNSDTIKAMIDKIKLPQRASTVSRALENDKLRILAWKQLERTWMEISNSLEGYGLFKKNFTINPHELALPTR